MSNSESEKKFYKRYQLTLIDNNKRCYRNARMNTAFFTDKNDMEIVDRMRTEYYGTEPLLTITVPESRLADLIALEERFFRHVAESGAHNTFALWIDHQNEERRLRAQYPAVQAAYEQYSTMLHLVKHST